MRPMETKDPKKIFSLVKSSPLHLCTKSTHILVAELLSLDHQAFPFHSLERQDTIAYVFLGLVE